MYLVGRYDCLERDDTCYAVDDPQILPSHFDTVCICLESLGIPGGWTGEALHKVDDKCNRRRSEHAQGAAFGVILVYD
jgi:hypothetical protein